MKAEEQPPAADGGHLIFINYRGSDEMWATELVYTRMTEEFGTGAVFKAGNSLQPGEDFPSALRRCYPPLMARAGPPLAVSGAGYE
jgi:hypothetical protein